MYVLWSEKVTVICKNIHEVQNVIEGDEKEFYGFVKVRKYSGNSFVEFNKRIGKYTFKSDVADILRFFKGVKK